MNFPNSIIIDQRLCFFFKSQLVGKNTAACDMTKSPPIACDTSIANFGCSAFTEPGVCQCNPPWVWDPATKACVCSDPLYRLVDTSCGKSRL